MADLKLTFQSKCGLFACSLLMTILCLTIFVLKANGQFEPRGGGSGGGSRNTVQNKEKDLGLSPTISIKSQNSTIEAVKKIKKVTTTQVSSEEETQTIRNGTQTQNENQFSTKITNNNVTTATAATTDISNFKNLNENYNDDETETENENENENELDSPIPRKSTNSILLNSSPTVTVTVETGGNSKFQSAVETSNYTIPIISDASSRAGNLKLNVTTFYSNSNENLVDDTVRKYSAKPPAGDRDQDRDQEGESTQGLLPGSHRPTTRSIPVPVPSLGSTGFGFSTGDVPTMSAFQPQVPPSSVVVPALSSVSNNSEDFNGIDVGGPGERVSNSDKNQNNEEGQDQQEGNSEDENSNRNPGPQNDIIRKPRLTVFAFNNYGGPSETFELSSSKCTTLPEDWHKRVSSIHTHGDCIEVCQFKNCIGRCFPMAPGTPGQARLRDINFDKRITSMRCCLSYGI